MELENNTTQTAQNQQMEPTISTPAPTPDEDTPDSNTENSSGQRMYHDAESAKAAEAQFRLGYETMTKCLGPMPIRSVDGRQNFLDEFLPLPDSIKRDKDMPVFLGDAFRSIPEEPRSEKALYEPMVTAFNKNSSKFIAVPTHEGDSTARSSKPDISIYLKGPAEAYTRDNRSGMTYANFGTMDFFIEVKKSRNDDCLRDDRDTSKLIDVDMSLPVDKLDPHVRARISSLGQSAHYASQIMARQHRTAVFSVMMSGRWLRLLRWDRSGTIVSEAFDVRERPEILCEFIWRLEQVDPDVCGYDTTVDKDSDLVHKHLFETTVKKRLMLELDIDSNTADEAINRHLDPCRLSIVSGMVDSDGQPRIYVISKPTCVTMSPTGRGTRGYWAYELETGRVGFLKDTWRTVVPDMESEGTITKELFEAGVRNVPDVECHGDVPSSLHGCPWQCTGTQDYIEEPWVKPLSSKNELRQGIVKHMHYRMFSNTVGCSLHEHKDIKEFLCAIRDIVDTLVDADEKCQRVHRDISASNAILVRDPVSKKRTAHIIDWELSVKKGESRQRGYTISGTWQFISYRLLRGIDTTPHRLEDDLESVFWVAYWYLLIYYSELSTSELSGIMRQVFDEFRPKSSGFTGGYSKKAVLSDPCDLDEGFESSQALVVKQWLKGYAKYLSYPDLCKEHPELLKTPSNRNLSNLRSNVLNLPDMTPINLTKRNRVCIPQRHIDCLD